MTFCFQPKTDAEINSLKTSLLSDGIYSGIIQNAEQQVSKSGNDMLRISINVFDQAGIAYFIQDYLVATEKMIFKVKHFCESAGFEKEYETGQLIPEKIVGRSVKVKVGIKKGLAKPDGNGYYLDRNEIKDYIKNEDVFSDEIAF